MEIISNDPCTFVAKSQELVRLFLAQYHCGEDHYLNEVVILLEKALEKLTERSM
jgi:hypothetical protein